MQIVKKERVDFSKGLRKLKGKVRQVKLFGFDIETYNNNKDFLCASIVGDDYEFFTKSKQALKNEIATNPIFKNSYICATNLMFDFFGTFSIREAFKNFKIIERGSGIILASTYCTRDQKDNRFYSRIHIDHLAKTGKIPSRSGYSYPITFIDSGNHLKTSVANLGKIIGHPKMEAPECLGDQPKSKKEWEYMKAYNIQDSMVTFRFMKFLQNHYNVLGCKLKSTISATTLDLFRRKYLGMKWEAETRERIQFCYQAYYGGRTEAFKRGIFNSDNYGQVKAYDVNSLYPYCLKNFKYPVPKGQYFREKITTDDVDSFEGVGYFTIKAPEDLLIPVLPVKTDKLRFPVGEFSGYYDFNSIRLALRNGYEIQDTGRGLIYENVFRPFKDMIKDLYKLRLQFKSEKNQAEVVVKLLMNSFYGKLGYKYYDKEFLGDGDAVGNAPKSCDIYPTCDPKIFRIRTTEESRIPPYVFPIYPLYVTSFARSTMFRHFQKVGMKRVIYSDTDCIFTTRTIPTSSDLGDMKLEEKFKELVIIKPKFYSGLTTEGKSLIKVKGIFKSINDYDHFKQMASDNAFNLTMTQFRKLRGAIGRSDRWVNQTYKVMKTMGLDDNKRVWEKDHFTLDPQNSIPRKVS